MTTLAHIVAFFVQDLLVVVGHNPEAADMANPRGAIHGIIWQVVAESRDGERHALRHAFNTQAAAERFCARVEAAHRQGRALDPDRWGYAPPAYGSRADMWEDSNMTPRQLAGEEF